MTEVYLGDHGVEPIAQRMRGSIELALREGSLYFDRQGSVWTTLRRIVRFLDDEVEPYAIIGALASFHHGYRRYTENVNLLVTTGIGKRLEGHCLDLTRLHPKGRTFFDRQTGVSVRFVVEGECPGGVEWRQIRFPHPHDIGELHDGIRFANLPALISLKLAAGLGNTQRGRDLCDVQELIKTVCLTTSLAEQLHPDVREAYLSMCREIDASSGPFLLVWDIEPRLNGLGSLEELIAVYGQDASVLEAMRRDGVTLFTSRKFYKNSAILTTNDRVVARKYHMHHESEHLFDD